VKEVSGARCQVSGLKIGNGVSTSNYMDMAKLKGYITEKVYIEFRGRYKEYIRMLNGLEKTLERKIPERECRWQFAEESAVYGLNDETLFREWPLTPET
jgi:hypothetical protein